MPTRAGVAEPAPAKPKVRRWLRDPAGPIAGLWFVTVKHARHERRDDDAGQAYVCERRGL